MPVGFLLLFFGYPVVHLIGVALVQEDSFSRIWSALGNDRVAGVLWFTAWQAVLSTLLTVIVALPGCWVLSRY